MKTAPTLESDRLGAADPVTAKPIFQQVGWGDRGAVIFVANG